MTDALATAEGRALAGELVEQLEAELVRFCHRVAHDHGIELDRARAAMVLLGTLVSAGVAWTAQPDSAPTKIHEAFSAMAARHPKASPEATVIRRELATFFVATANVQVADAPATTPAALLRRAGAEPRLWWWASEHAQRAPCWEAAAEDVGATVQLALAFGVGADHVVRALAATLGIVVARLKTRRTQQRHQLQPLLAQLASAGSDALADRALVGAITKLAFEVTAGRQTWWQDAKRPPDAFDDLAICAFQLVELLQLEGPPDLERYAELARRPERAFAACGLRYGALLRKELDPIVAPLLRA